MIQALVNGSWLEVTSDQIQKGDLFRIIIGSRTAGNLSMNSIGSDTFRAAEDAVMGDDGNIIVTIDRPHQPKFSTAYRQGLAAIGAVIQVKGSSGATGSTGDFRNV